MSLRALPRLFAWAIVVGFLADVLRRCWIAEAWSIAPIAAALLVLALTRLRRAWRSALRRGSTDFIRPRLPVSNFPAQPKRPIR